ncbi:membrane-bound O-acyltransferase family protein [Priestia megaterium]|nr:membrane-bound O-acyltransferase family protein [Priestia megaterium]
MVFSNLVFLYAFFPIVLILYFCSPRFLKNSVLLVASLFFYAWGEPTYVFLMLFSILINYGYGIWIEKSHHKPTRKLGILWFAIVINIALLGYFKYANFFVGLFNSAFHTDIHLDPIPLPIGISFYTFHALSYLIDVYRKTENAQRNLFNLALYITFFPQLVAGPIIRYNSVAEQLEKRVFSSAQFAEGIKRFILGLSKKVLIANPLGSAADNIFAISSGDLTTGTAWLGIVCYTLQIYFDFSGYSDMAIGLGKMFGFEFQENFNYPYIARSASEFWRRWHISLGRWFRDYLYIPLGGNRVSPWRVYVNLLIVWTVTGFWHGASWTFMAWGFYYGFIMCLEKAFLEKWLHALWRPIQHIYLLVIVMVGWVFFRADNFGYSFHYIKTMFFLEGDSYNNTTLLFLVDNAVYLGIGLLLCAPLFPYVRMKLETLASRSALVRYGKDISGSIVYVGLLLLVTMYLVNSTYNPFIYFRF